MIGLRDSRKGKCFLDCGSHIFGRWGNHTKSGRRNIFPAMRSGILHVQDGFRGPTTITRRPSPPKRYNCKVAETPVTNVRHAPCRGPDRCSDRAPAGRRPCRGR